MSSFRYEYAVIGGDLRQAYLLKELECRKENVCHFALCPQARQVCHTSYSPALSSLEAAVTGSKRIICPIPFGKDFFAAGLISADARTIFFCRLYSRQFPSKSIEKRCFCI